MVKIRMFFWVVSCSLALCFAGDPLFDFSLWDRVLQRHVDTNGEIDGIRVNTIDYCGVGADPEFAEFLAYLDAVEIDNLSKNETYALYINAYNAFAVNVVAQNPFPEGSCITKIGDVPDVFNIPIGSVGGREMTLSTIEDFLRDPTPYSEDCRVHGCLVCMGISCPNLRAEAYVPERIDEQMDDNVREWLANDKKGSALVGDSLFVSAIFSWADGDFRSCAGGPTAAFVAEYAPPEVAAFIADEGAEQVRLQYLVYDHLLCGAAPCDCPPGDDRAVAARAFVRPSPARLGPEDWKLHDELGSLDIPPLFASQMTACAIISVLCTFVVFGFVLAVWTRTNRRSNREGVSAETLLAH